MGINNLLNPNRFGKLAKYSLVEVDEVAVDGLTAGHSWCDVCQLDSATKWAVIFRETTGDDGWIWTFDLGASYDAISELGELEYEATSGGTYGRVYHMGGDHVAVVHRGTDNDGFVTTIEYNPTTYALTDRGDFEFETDNMLFPDAYPLNTDHIVIAYGGSANDGYIQTIDLDISGSYTVASVDTVEYDINNGIYNSLVLIENLIGTRYFILAYQGLSADGYAQTFSTNASHVISTIDNLEYDGTNTYSHDMIELTTDLFCVASSTVTPLGLQINILSTDASHVITDEQETYIESATQTSWMNLHLIEIDGSGDYVVGCLYRGISGYAYWTVFTVDSSTYAITKLFDQTIWSVNVTGLRSKTIVDGTDDHIAVASCRGASNYPYFTTFQFYGL